MHCTEHSEAFSRETLFRQIGPLVGAILLWLVYSDNPRLPDEYSEAIIWGAALITLAVMLTVLLPWQRLPRFAMLVPPLVYVLAASGFGPGHGDPLSSWAGLFLLPVFWLSVYATGLELAAGVVAVALAILPVGSAASRPDLAQAFMLIALAGALGVGSQRLFQEVRLRASALKRLTRSDPLTGVPTRRVWEAALAVQLADARRAGVPTSVALLDVDRFKAYNDRFGRQTGDRLLKFFAARWQSELRNVDILARIGGDQFAVLLPRCHLDAGGAVIRRLCSVSASTTTSAGVACWNGHESTGKLIARAERALSQAKAEGGSRIVLAGTPPPPAPPRSPQSIHLAHTPES